MIRLRRAGGANPPGLRADLTVHKLAFTRRGKWRQPIAGVAGAAEEP